MNKIFSINDKNENDINSVNPEYKLNKAKKLIDLSFMLKQMRSKKYKRNLFEEILYHSIMAFLVHHH